MPTQIQSCLKRVRPVKYRVTGPFGYEKKGTLLNAWVLFEEQDQVALVFHPDDDTGCGSLEFCVRNGGVYESTNAEGDWGTYINLNKGQAKVLRYVVKLLSKLPEDKVTRASLVQGKDGVFRGKTT